MGGPGRVDIACFSYLAAVTTLRVAEYPPADYGAMVDDVEQFLAGDGPIVAAAATAAGLTAALVSNRVANDENGRYLIDTLRSWGVAGGTVEADPERRRETPFSTVVSTDRGSRAWFPYLPGVLADLACADLTPLATARVTYVDCYEILGDTSYRAVAAALEGDGLVVANLGGSPPPAWLTKWNLKRRLSVLQTSVPEDSATSAVSVAAVLADRAVADQIVVTRGRHGALVVAGELRADIPAPVVQVKGVQGAGAVFSAVLVSGLLRGDDLPKAALHACNSASAWCSRPVVSAGGQMFLQKMVVDE